MTGFDTADDDPTTSEEFRTALGRLIRRASENGVDVEGGYAFETGDGHRDWGVEVHAVFRTRS